MPDNFVHSSNLPEKPGAANRGIIKLYNMIFPFWLLLYILPILMYGIPLIGNLIIDFLVVYIMFRILKVKAGKRPMAWTVFRIWMFGFVSDLIAALICVHISNKTDLSYALCYDPYTDYRAIFVLAGMILLGAILIFVFNWFFSFRNLSITKVQKRKVCFALAIITAPWLFLVPTSWFFRY